MLPGLRYHLPDATPPEQKAAVLKDLAEFAGERRRHDLRGAAILGAVRRLGIHLQEGFSSVADLAESRGITAYSARELDDLAAAIAGHQEIVPDVEQGRIPVANGAVLGRVDREGDLLRPGDDWVTWARTMRPRDFARRFHERRDEVRQGEPVMALVARLTYKGLRDFERARKLASRSAQQGLTAGQTVVVLVDEYLDEHDPLRARGAARRTPDTGTPAAVASGSRSVPAAVNRSVRSRNGDRCEVETCSNDIFLTLSHRKPHREGGSRESDNLDLLCAWHHALYEQGVIRITGTPDAPVITMADGRIIGPATIGMPNPSALDPPKSETS